MKTTIILILVCVQAMMLSVMASSATALTWTPEVQIDSFTPGTVTGSSPKIAVDPNGNIMAVWVQSDGTFQNIYANLYLVGSGWGTATLLEISEMPADSPQIVADANGNFIAVWRQAWKTVNGVLYGIYANRYVAGIGWGAVATVYVDTGRVDVTANGDPKIAVDPNGNAMAVWSVYDWSWNHTSVRANRYEVATGWSGVTNLSTEAVQISYSPQVAMDSYGNAIVVWHQDYGTSPGVYADRYTVGAGWGTPALIGASSGQWDGQSPQIAFDLNGNAISVWTDYPKAGIRTNRYVAGVGWGATQTITDPSNSTYYDEGVQLAIDKNGTAIAVWNQSGAWLYANRYVAGIGWGITETIDPGYPDYSEQIAFDQNGNAIAIWGYAACNSSNIQAIPYVVGVGWGSAPRCYEATNYVNKSLDLTREPQIVIDKNGNATAVWVRGYGSYGSIYASTSTTCTYAISPTSAALKAFANTGTITVTPSSSFCPWTATSNAPWITLTSGASGSGSGIVSYSYTANATSSERSGTIIVGGQTVTVTQNVFSLKGDINGDGYVNMADAVLALKVVAGLTPAGVRTNYPTSGADVNGDDKVGMQEGLYILQRIAGLRDSLNMWHSRTPVPSGTSTFFEAIAAGPSGFLIGGQGTIQKSLDGVTWYNSNIGSNYDNFLGLAGAADGALFAAGRFGLVLKSTDVATTWAASKAASSSGFMSIAAGDGKIVAVGYDSSSYKAVIYTSADGGATWSETAPAGINVNSYDGITFGNGKFVVVGYAFNGAAYMAVILTSTDGSTWTAANVNAQAGLRGVTWGGGKFVAVGNYGAILTSPDGSNWAVQNSGITDKHFNHVGYGGGFYVIAGTTGTILSSSDGSAWTSQPSGTTKHLWGVAFGINTFLVVGGDDTSPIILQSDPL